MKDTRENAEKHIIIEEKMRRVVDAMALAGMPLAEEEKAILYDCFSGRISFEEVREAINKKYEGGKGGK